MLPLIETFAAQLLLGLLALGLGIALLLALKDYWHNKINSQHELINRINRCLPQTQCGKCGFAGCLPYARAIASGTPINQCPPGGDKTLLQLANLLSEPIIPLNPAHGRIQVETVAVIREEECIGCAKCIIACPVDAILGAAKLMHTVIETECTGCDLCVEPCPVDCIDMIARPRAAEWYWPLPSAVRTQVLPMDASA